MIEITNLTKYYDNFKALDNINLKVEKGEILGLLGPNGAGKTTAMRILSCFIPATSGTAKVAGYDVFEDSMEVRRRLGYLPETPPVYPEMSVGSYLDFVGRIRELRGNELKQRITHVLSRLGLNSYNNRIIGTLSKGYRQRVGLAQAMIHNPEVLILDEPTVGLDPSQIIEIRELIKDLANDHTVILSTHILSEVSATCNKVVIIKEGTIVKEDTLANLENQTLGKPSWHILLYKSKDYSTENSEDWRTVTNSFKSEISELKEENNLISFNLRLNEEKMFDDFFIRMASAGYIIKETIPLKASLEDIYLKLTGKSENSKEEDKKAEEKQEIKEEDKKEDKAEVKEETNKENSHTTEERKEEK